jgi:hypothetical protein
MAEQPAIPAARANGSGMLRVERLRRSEQRRLRLWRMAAACACILALGLGGALFFPARPGPGLGFAEELRARDLLYAIETDAVSAAAGGTETSFTLSEECLTVLISDLLGRAGGDRQVWVRSRTELVRVWLRLATPLGIPAVVELRLQPSLLDGSLFCALRGVRVGLCPVPPAWHLAIHGAGNPGWMQSRGSYGYAFPGEFLLRGQRFEIVDLFAGDGLVEVSIRPVPQGGD